MISGKLDNDIRVSDAIVVENIILLDKHKASVKTHIKSDYGKGTCAILMPLMINEEFIVSPFGGYACNGLK